MSVPAAEDRSEGRKAQADLPGKDIVLCKGGVGLPFFMPCPGLLFFEGTAILRLITYIDKEVPCTAIPARDAPFPFSS